MRCEPRNRSWLVRPTSWSRAVQGAAVACALGAAHPARGWTPRPSAPDDTETPAATAQPAKQTPAEVWVPLGLQPINARACVRFAWEEDVEPAIVRVDSEPQGAAVVWPDGRRMGATPLDVPLPRRRVLGATVLRQGGCVVSDRTPAARRDDVVLGYTTDETGGRWDPAVARTIATDAISEAGSGFESAGRVSYAFTRVVRGWIAPDRSTVRDVELTFDCTWDMPVQVSSADAASGGARCDASLDVLLPPTVPVPNPEASEFTAQVRVELVLAGFQSQSVPLAAETPSNTKNSVYIQPMLATRQSQVVVNSSCSSDMSGQVFGALTPSARDSGSQNTLKP